MIVDVRIASVHQKSITERFGRIFLAVQTAHFHNVKTVELRRRIIARQIETDKSVIDLWRLMQIDGGGQKDDVFVVGLQIEYPRIRVGMITAAILPDRAVETVSNQSSDIGAENKLLALGGRQNPFLKRMAGQYVYHPFVLLQWNS